MLLIGSNGARLIVHAIVPFDNSGEYRLVFPVSRPKTITAVAIFDGIVCDIGHGGPTWR